MKQETRESFNKEWLLECINERLDTLKGYMSSYNKGKAVNSGLMTAGSAAYKRSITKRDICICSLIKDLVEQIKSDDVLLTADSEKGFLKLAEPNERHINKRRNIK